MSIDKSGKFYIEAQGRMEGMGFLNLMTRLFSDWVDLGEEFDTKEECIQFMEKISKL